MGIGIDITEVSRFNEWKSYEKDQLEKVFSARELEECSPLTSEFLASRFAAKEAFYKAISNLLIRLKLTDRTFSFQFARTHIEVIKGTWDIPQLQVDWAAFEKKIGASLPPLEVHLSLSHEKLYATAIVVLQAKK